MNKIPIGIFLSFEADLETLLDPDIIFTHERVSVVRIHVYKIKQTKYTERRSLLQRQIMNIINFRKFRLHHE